MAIEETGYGVAADKERKNRSAAEGVWARYRSLRTVGVISESEGVVEIATPRGVIAGITPSTEPTSSAIFKALISVKSRNALVLSPHHAATRCTNETVHVLREAAVEEGLPPEALGCMTRVTREGTRTLMEHEYTAVVLATGGDGLVPAAYSSENPAFGVGAANVSVFVERTANVGKAARDIMVGKCFENGMACASEQSVVVDAPLGRALREQFRARGGYFLSAAEAGRLSRVVVTRDGRLNPAVVGKSAALIALDGRHPRSSRYPLPDRRGRRRRARLPALGAEALPDPGLLRRGGDAAGHGPLPRSPLVRWPGSHRRNTNAFVPGGRSFGEKMPVSRVVVNTSTAHGALGLSTALSPSLLLGCWSRGNNITSDDVSPLHLMDIKRIVVETQPIEGVTPTLIDATWELEVAA